MGDSHRTSVLRYLAAYTLWAFSVAASILAGLLVQGALIRMAAMAAKSAASAPDAALNAGLRVRSGNVWSFFLMGLILVVVVVFIEFWYREGAEAGELLIRFLRVTTVQFSVLSVVHGAHFLTVCTSGQCALSDVLVPCAELVGVLVCALAYRQARRSASA